MKLFIPLTLVFSLISAEVLQLSDSNFSEYIDNIDLALVKFYAPWCGHCKKIAPEFIKAATILKENDPPVILGEVDCTIHDKICAKHGVSGYPTLKVFRNGVAGEYNGGRDTKAIVSTMAGQAGPSSSEITNEDKVKKLMASTSGVLIGFFEENAAEVKPFMRAADELRESIKFAHTFNSDIAKSLNAELGQIHFFRPSVMKSKFETQQVKYSHDKFTTGLIRNWAKETKNGLCPVVEPADIESVGFPIAIAIYNVDYKLDVSGSNYWRNRVMRTGKEFSGIKFAVGHKGSWNGLVSEMGLSFRDKSPVVIVFGDKNSKYVMKDQFDPKGTNFKTFLENYTSGKIEKHMKSEGDIDNSNNDNKILTAKNFETEVDGSKDAFLEFYAPWCGHCKTLAPKWEEMATKVKSLNLPVVVGKMDATANDVPSQYEVKGFPTIFWQPKHKNGKPQPPVPYQGGRETKDLVKWAKEHASSKDEL